MTTRGRGSRQDGPHLDAVADRSLSDPSLQSLSCLWTTRARCRCPGQLSPHQSPRTPSPERAPARSRPSSCWPDISPSLADPRTFVPFVILFARPTLDTPPPTDRQLPGPPARDLTLCTTLHRIALLSKLAPFDPFSATLRFRPTPVFLAPSAVRPLAPTI